MADKNFEQKVHQQMQDFKLHPSDAVWQNVDARLRKDKRRRWFFFLLTTSMLIATGTGLFYTQQQKTTIATFNKADEKTQSAALTVNQTPEDVTASTFPASTDASNAKPTVNSKEEKNNEASLSLNDKLISKTPTTINQNQQVNVTVNNSTSRKQFLQQQSSLKINVKGDAAANLPNVQTNSDKPVPSSVPASPVQQNEVVSSSVVQITSISQKLVMIADSSSTQQRLFHTKVITPPVVSNTDSAVATFPSAKSETKKRKWQTGFQVNTGLADIKESLFPGGEYKSFETNAFTGGTSAGIPLNVITGITTNEYLVKNSVNAGAGLIIRKPIFKQSWFATGLQYQFSSFVVNGRVSRDTFSASQNRLVNDFTNESKESFSSHYIQIPTGIQWHIAKTTKGNLMLGTGLMHSFRFTGTSVKPLFADSSSGANFYQPLFQLTPAYEWKTKTGVMQLGWYFNYGLLPVYNGVSKNHWWQTGIGFQYFFSQKKQKR
jgi:hypothetical protein